MRTRREIERKATRVWWGGWVWGFLCALIAFLVLTPTHPEVIGKTQIHALERWDEKCDWHHGYVIHLSPGETMEFEIPRLDKPWM